MKKNQCNTAIFIICNDDSYDNVLKLRRKLNDLGFEPYIVSNDEQFLADANLFIRMKDCTPIGETIYPYCKEWNLYFHSSNKYKKKELRRMLKI